MSAAATAAGYLYASGRLGKRRVNKKAVHAQDVRKHYPGVELNTPPQVETVRAVALRAAAVRVTYKRRRTTYEICDSCDLELDECVCNEEEPEKE